MPLELDGSANLRRDFEAYEPASNLAFLDVSEPSIEDGVFDFDLPGNGGWRRGPFNWLRKPGERHGKGANLSFLDGHVEGHRWLFTPKRSVSGGGVSVPVNELDRQDLMWIIDRTHFGQWRRRQLGLP